MGIEGKILGSRYEILIKIGSGGMATVYKAKDKVLKRFVAVKILRDEFKTDDEFIKKFEIEAQSAARLTHPNIVSIYDVGVEDNFNYIVMELIKGKTLKEIILEEKRPLPWKWSVNIASQIASALDVAHRNNIIHRDIKPHNIIITEDGIAKVTDFGIAKAVSNSTITAFGKTMGSVHYFSPEHARGGITDEKSDIYSLGVVLYEMVTGKLPFDSDTPVSVALKHMQESPKEPRRLNPRVPKAVNDIIMKALQKDPNKRYQSAQEMYEDLQMAIKDPNGNFVEEIKYDPTAKTQIVNKNQSLKQPKQINNQDDNEDEEEDDEYYEESFFSRFKIPIIGVLLVLIFIGSIFFTKLFISKDKVEEVNIPNVVGKNIEVAKQEVEDAKLKFVVEKEEFSKEYEKDTIISQDPIYLTGYNKVKEGTSIKVVVSKGTEKTTMPYVVGLTKEEAIKLIDENKLKADIKEETSPTIKEGIVISQEYGENKELDAGDVVKIVISSGTGIVQVDMIKVVGDTQEVATKKLEDLKLKVNIQTISDSSMQSGVVTKQSINEGVKIDEGTTVTLTVNKVEETKKVALHINVKKITGGIKSSQNNNVSDQNTIPDSNTINNNNSSPSTVKVVVKNDETNKEIWSGSVSKDDADLKIDISGKGELKVKVEISDTAGESWIRTETINFNSQTSAQIS